MVNKHKKSDQLLRIYTDINRLLKPVLVKSVSSNECESLYGELICNSENVLNPLLMFLDSNYPDYDYEYNDLVGFDEGKWSVELIMMLDKDVMFEEHDYSIFVQHKEPIWVLRIVISLIHPIYIMAIEKWELSETRKNWIDTYPDNISYNKYSNEIIKITEFLNKEGYKTLSTEILAIIPEKDDVIGERNWTIGQLLFNEVYAEELDILSV